MVGMYNDDIAIYPDDENCNLFYCLRTKPKIRMENGLPVFSAMFWTNDKAETADKAVRLAGGEVTFDAHLGITTDERQGVIDYIKKSKYQDLVIKRMLEEEEMKNNARDTIMQYTGANISTTGFRRIKEKGEITLGSIEFREGSVNILEEVGGALVSYSSAGTKPSMFGDNNSANKISLTPTGAEVWYRALDNDNKPISIIFDMKAQVRLPALEVHAYAGSYQKDNTHGVLQEVTERVDKTCSSTKTTHMELSEITREIVDSGLIVVEIRPSSASVTNECIDQVRDSVMNTLTKKIESIIQAHFEGMTAEERKESLLTKLDQELRAFTEIRYTQEDVLMLSLAPQCSLNHFLEDLTEEQRKSALAVYDLRDPIFRPRRVIDIAANAPWDYISELEVKVESGKEVETFIFDKDKTSDKWELKVDDDVINPVYYTTTVHFQGGGKAYSFSRKMSNGDIFVEAGKVGLIDILFKPHPNLVNLSGKNKVTIAKVEIEYEGTDGKLEQYSFPLSPDNKDGERFLRHIGKVVEKPINYQVKYDFKTRDSIVTPKKSFFLTSDDQLTVYTPYPFEDSLDITVSAPPFAPDSKVEKVTVELKYYDAMNDFTSFDSVILSSEAGWDNVMTHLPVMDRSVDNFQYRFTIKSDRLVKSDWLDARGEGETLILPIQQYIIMCNLLGLGEEYTIGELRITSTDGQINQSFFLDDTVAAKKKIEFFDIGSSGATREFKYEMTLYSVTGQPVTTSGSWTGNVFMLPKPPQQTQPQQQTQEPQQPQQPAQD